MQCQTAKWLLKKKAAPVFREGFLPAKLSVQTIRDERHLVLAFPLPSMQPHYRVKPEAYVSYLLGHEGEGSLYAVLKKRGWAEKLAAGASESNSFNSLFAVDITLTNEGYRHTDDIVKLFFETVNMLKDKGVVSWQYDEQKMLADLSFRFHEKQDAMQYVSELANNMQSFVPKDVLRGSYMMEGLQTDKVVDLLGRLNPANVLVVVTAADAIADQKDPLVRLSHHYQTPYKVEPVSDEQFALWGKAETSAGIRMPENNPFIPDKLKIKPAPFLAMKSNVAQVPQRIGSSKNYNLWFLQDTKFNMPKGSIMVYARSSHTSTSVREAAMSELFVRLLNDHLNPLLYTASLAGLDFSISKRSRGIAFQLTGYSDKQGLLLKSVMDTFRNPVFDEARFSLVKKQWEDELRNADKQAPYQVIMQDIPVVLAHGYWGRNEYLQTLGNISLKDVQNHVLEFSQGIVADMLVYGNFYEAEAVKLAGIVENTLNLASPRLPAIPVRVVALPPVDKPFLHIDELEHNDAVLVSYLQAASDSVQEQVRMEMLDQVVGSAFFHSLRTEQQLGYIVSSNYLPLVRVPGMVFLVQSPSYGSGDINKRMEVFIEKHYSFLKAQDDAWFEQQRQALMTQYQEKPKNISEQAMEFWNDMILDYTGFDMRAQQIAALQAMTRQDLLDTYRITLMEKQRRQLLLVTPGKNGIKNLLEGSAQKFTPVDNPETLKASMPSHALP